MIALDGSQLAATSLVDYAEQYLSDVERYLALIDGLPCPVHCNWATGMCTLPLCTFPFQLN